MSLPRLPARLLGTACMFFAVAATAAPPLDGTLDAGFGSGGRRTIGFDLAPASPIDVARKALVDASRRTYLVGTAVGPQGHQMAVVRLTPAGTLDGTYGTSGKALTPPNFDLSGMTAAFDGDHLLVAGFRQFPGTDSDFVVCRFGPTGELAPFPGNAGQSSCVSYLFDLGGTLRDLATAMAVDGQGRILLAGNAAASNDQGHAAVVRLLPDGALDPSFGNAGRLHFLVAGHSRHRIHDLALQANGKFYLIGETQLTGETARRGMVARVTAAGQLDASFGPGGFRAYIHLSADRDTYFLAGRLHRATAVTDASLTLVGATEKSAGTGLYNGLVARIVPGGNLQGAFATNGAAAYSGGASASLVFSGLVEHADGRMVGVGTQTATPNIPSDFIAVGMRSDGLPDLQGFNAPSGRLVVDFETPGGQDTAYGVAVGSDRVVIAGATLWNAPNDLDFAVATLRQERIFANGHQPAD